MTTTTRRPLVLAAMRAAVEQARHLGLRRCLENAVEEAIAAGCVHGEPRVRDVTRVYLDGDGLVVDVRRVLSPTGRKAWLPVAVRRLTTTNREGT